MSSSKLKTILSEIEWKGMNVELGKVYTFKDIPPFKTPQQIKEEEEAVVTEPDNDREMVVGVAEIVSMVSDTENRKEIAAKMMKKFDYENVKYNQEEFLKLSGVTASIDELVQMSIQNVAADLVPKDISNAITPESKERYISFIRDLIGTLNMFYKKHGVDRRFTNNNFKYTKFSK
jgi:hypothetical protein